MPIYEYECAQCSCHFEKRQRFYDEPIAECPNCHSKSQRVFNPAPVIFKGSGFYVTDYRKEKNTENTPKPESTPKPKESSTSPKDK
jgi:putative FmdB family regulatory protein